MNTNTPSPSKLSESKLEGSLEALAQLLQARKPANGGDPESSYVARLMDKGPDAILKKIGEEATEVVLAAKDVENNGAKSALVYEMADLWFHSMVALAYFDLSPKDVVAELMRRAGTSGINEKAMRKVKAREEQSQTDASKPA